MKLLYTFALGFLLNLTGFAQVTDTLVMIWNDEFNGTQIDATKWQDCPEWFRQGGSYWEGDNASLNGNGELELKVTEVNNKVYCGAIRTRGLFDKKYGYFEVRCDVPQMHGGWAAFWMMPMQNQVGSWGDDGTEIDIFESINGWNGKINHALHWDGYGADHQKESTSLTRPDLYDNQQHIFGMMWTPTEYIFYIDNQETWRTSAGGVSDVEQYLKLTMEVSGDTWPGNWNNQITKPIYWTIDYVRVYEYGVTTSVDPEIELIKPYEGQVFTLGDTVKLRADITGDLGKLDELKFLAQKTGGSDIVIKLKTLDGVKTSYYTTWTPNESGDYTIKVRGYEASSFVTKSVDTQIEVVDPIITVVEDNFEDGVKIYPNPSLSGVFYLSKFVDYKIYNVMGKLILEGSGNQVNLSFIVGTTFILKTAAGETSFITK